MGRIIKKRILTLDWHSFLPYMTVFKLLTVAVIIPLVSGAFSLMMRFSGYRFLSWENVFAFIRHPFVLICLLIFLLGCACYELLEIGLIRYILQYHQRKSKPRLAEAAVFAWQYMKHVLCQGKAGAVLIAALLMIPFGSVTMAPVFLSRTVLKDILEGLSETPRLLIPVVIVILIGVIDFALLKYVFLLIQPEDRGIRQALRRSVEIGKKHWLYDFLFYLVAQIVYLAVFLLTALLLITGTILLEQIFGRLGVWKGVSVFVVLTVLNVNAALFIAANGPYSEYILVYLLRRHSGEISEIPPNQTTTDQRIPTGDAPAVGSVSVWYKPVRDLPPALSRVGFPVFIITLLVLCGYYSFASYKGRFNPAVEFLHTTEVTAHRGASRYYPENTMSAFRGAVEQGADWIELDIQQSSDGQIFVMHDSDFRRTTGVRAKAWTLPWDEIQKMDAGKWFGASFEGEPIPLLAEAIDFAKENMVYLNIELKPTGNEPDFEKHLVELLHEKDFVNFCVVTSQVYSSIMKVKELDENIQTVYVTSFAYGNLHTLTAADAFSIKTGSISDRLVSRLHGEGKKILAWTANSRGLIDEMIEMQVDNVITDDVVMAKDRVAISRTPDAVWTYVRWLRRLFRT